MQFYSTKMIPVHQEPDRKSLPSLDYGMLKASKIVKKADIVDAQESIIKFYGGERDEAVIDLTDVTGIDIPSNKGNQVRNTFVDNGSGGEFVIDGETFYWAVDEEALDDIAVDITKDDVYNNPEAYRLEDYINFNSAESIFRSIYDEMNENYVGDIKGENSTKYTNRFAEEALEKGLISKEDASNPEFDLENIEDRFVDQMTQSQIDEGNGGFDYYVSNFGQEEANNFLLNNNLVDYTEVAEQYASSVGWADVLGYSFEDETPEGVVIYTYQ